MIWLYWAWRLGTLLVSWIPHRLSYALAGGIGWIGYYLMPLRRQIARENFSHVLGKPANDPTVARVARASFQNYARLLRDTMLYAHLSYPEIEARVTIHDANHLEAALARGKGVILVSAHFGNMDMAGAVLGMRYTPVTLVSESLRPRQLMEWLVSTRVKYKVIPYPYDRAPRKMIEAIKRNEMTALLLDFGVTHHFDLTTVPVRFFGTETNFPAGPAQLALLTDAAIIVGYTRLGRDGQIDVYPYPPLLVERTGHRHHDLQVTMQKIANMMEEFIRLSPEQWYIFRPMWKDASTAHRKIPSLSQPNLSHRIKTHSRD